MTVENKKRFIVNFIYVVIVLFIIYFALKYALNLVMPFFIAFICAAVLYPIIRWLHKKLKWNKKLISVIVTILFFSTIGVLIGLLVFKAVVYSVGLLNSLPGYYTDTILPVLNKLAANISDLLKQFGIEENINLSTVFSSLYDKLLNLTTSLLSKLVSFLSSVPNVLLMIVIMIVSTFFLTADFEHISKWLLAQLSQKAEHTVTETKTYITKILFKYIRSYALILSITFAELLICLFITHFITGLNNYLLLAFVIAVFDILPIVGTGTILIPWAIIDLVIGNYVQAICLVLTYIIIFIVRQIIEPKIVGKQVGLHPLATLVGMIVGTKLFGVIGLFGLPITLALLKDLNDSGKIHIFKPISDDAGDGQQAPPADSDSTDDNPAGGVPPEAKPGGSSEEDD